MPSHRPRTALLVACLSMPALLPLGSASDPCAEAQDHLAREWEASAHRLSPSVAQALRDVVDRCPRALSASLPAAEPSGPPGAADSRVPLPASGCGYDEWTTHTERGAPVDVTMQITVSSDRTRESGDATVTYHPSTGLTTYEVRGPTYGFLAQSTGAGTLFVHGVAIAADPDATAKAGCLEPGGSLCWGAGLAKLTVPYQRGVLFTIQMRSEFHACA